MHLWFRAIIILAITGFSKAQHFIHLAILGALGLVGLWLLHVLAQDINKLFNKPLIAAPPKFFFSKRSIDNEYFINGTTQKSLDHFNIDWNRILMNDPIGCARSFVCQLAAENLDNSSNFKTKMMKLFRSINSNTWAGSEIRFALNYGTKLKKVESCRMYYKYCPFSINTMTAILHFLGAT